jgi:hypothetical protein
MPPAAGYSGTPLVRKLGIDVGTTVVTISAPANYAKLLGPLPMQARITSRLPKKPSFVHVFATSRDDLAGHLRKLRSAIEPDGVVWVSWPKKAAKVKTDITEDTIREVALPIGFVDVKVCAVDETWSGLKLVIRRELRTVASR